MTPLERWNGLACVWLWKGLARCRGGVFSGHSVPPQTRHVRLVKLSCLGDPPLPFLPQANQGQAMETCESAQTDDCTGNHPRSTSKPMFRATFVTCSRTHQGMVTDGLEELGFSSQKSPKKPINRVCLGEESTDEPTRPESSSTDRGRRRWDLQRPPRQDGNVKSTWPGCEVKLGTCQCLQYHMFHTRVPGGSSPTTEILLWWYSTPRSVRRNHFSRLMGTAMERKPTPALQTLAP